MKSKIISITTVLAVMVAMTGIAAANPYNVAMIGGTNPIELAKGQSQTLDVKVDTLVAIPALPHTIVLDPAHPPGLIVTCKTAGCTTTDIIATPVAGKWPFSATTDPFTKTGAVTISRSLFAVDPDGTEYFVTLYTCDSNTGNCALTFAETAVTSRTIGTIPEFPAVALPVAGIIGLVFFFQHRKKKEEK
jgi:hypothetical protein